MLHVHVYSCMLSSLAQHTDSAQILSQDAAAVRANRAATATRGFFLLSGIGMASWAPMVPFAKARLGLDEAQLGIVLLCMGLGSTGAMPLAGFLTHRYGPRKVLMVSGVVLCVALPLLTVAPSAVALGAVLALFGGALGVTDV